jgi:quinol monooxygenase YgiN
MYVRITRGRFQPERIDDVEAMASEVADAIKILPGFLGYQGGVDRNTSMIVAINNWEDRASAEFPRDKLGDVLGRVTALVKLEPAEIYEATITL